MVSVAELLNPEPPRAPLPTSRPALGPQVPRTVAFRDEDAPARRPVETPRMENTKNPSRCKVRAVINFPPFETLDEASLREVRKFHVHPFGSIRETCERIPYNSGKKDFFSKTGREGFEAFHYDFKVPGDEANYTVMWDYSVGLVRMTSFFKCRGYSKTTPAKMLNLNPGLKDITYSITGGSIKAQGYWMPYSCAKAICATFCHKIAGALIPLFGPQFPRECIHEKAPGYGRMIINPELVAQAKRDATALFRPPAGLPSPQPSLRGSPLPSQYPSRVPDRYDHHSDHERRLLLSPYTDTDADYHPGLEPYGRRGYSAVPPMRIPTSIPPITGPAPVPTPLHSPGWTAVNQPSLPGGAYHHRRAVSHLNEELLGLNVSTTANPWLSAVPRSPTPTAGGGPNKWNPYHPNLRHHRHPHSHHQRQQTSSPLSTSLPEGRITLPPLRLKRRFDQVEDIPNHNNTSNNHHPGRGTNDNGDDAYDASSSRAGSVSPASSLSTSSTPEDGASIKAPPSTPPSVHAHVGGGNGSSGAGGGMPSPSTPTTALGSITISTITIPTVAGAATAECCNPCAVRRASERDAAIMLLHMRGNSASASSSGSDDGDDLGCDRKRGISVGGQSRGQAEKGPESAGGERAGDKDADADEGEDEIGGQDGGGARGKEDAVRVALPAAAKRGVEVSVHTGGGGGGGPNTRAKRRRTADI